MKKEILYHAKYIEWLASLLGACFISFGLGVLLHKYFEFIYLWIILIGIILHSWGMYKTHRRNK